MEGAIDRRSFLIRGLAIPGSVAGLVAACTDSEQAGQLLGPQLSRGGNGGGYGPLVNDQGILLLPEGFQMRAFGAETR